MKGTHYINHPDPCTWHTGSKAATATVLRKQPGMIYGDERPTERLAMYCSPDQIINEEGLAGLGGTEAVVLGSLSTQIRSCIATCGGGGGAAARGDCWRYLFGFITIWLGERQYMQPL